MSKGAHGDGARQAAGARGGWRVEAVGTTAGDEDAGAVSAMTTGTAAVAEDAAVPLR